MRTSRTASPRGILNTTLKGEGFAYKSACKPIPLTDLEKMLVVSACGGNTSWHHMIYRAARSAPPPLEFASA